MDQSMDIKTMDHSMDIVSADIDSFELPDANDSYQENEAMTTESAGNNVVDKETLLKMKRRERSKLNRQKKKALQKNIVQLTAVELQQSVASLATTVGGISSCIVNDPLARRAAVPEAGVLINGNGQEYSSPAANDVSVVASDFGGINQADVGKAPAEIAICVMDTVDQNVRHSYVELNYVNDYLDKSICNDLTIAPKIKISNSYLCNAKRVWIICHSSFTSSWVVEKIAEMPELNGRKFAAHTLASDVLTEVTVLVPKECTMVKDFEDLMRFLIIQNPNLNKGRAVLTKDWGVMTVNDENQEYSLESTANKSTDETTETGGIDAKKEIEISEEQSSDPINNDDASECHTDLQVKEEDHNEDSRGKVLVEPEAAVPCNKSFTFYVDDTWLGSLRHINYRPYLGVRRLLTVVGNRFVRSAGNGAVTPGTSYSSRNRRRRKAFRSIQERLGVQRPFAQ